MELRGQRCSAGTTRSLVTAMLLLSAILLTQLCSVAGFQTAPCCVVGGGQWPPFAVRPPQAPFWSFAPTDNTAAASELNRAPRAVFYDRRLAFDPNLPPGLNLPPREIADVTAGINPGFARQAPGLDVLGELNGLEQLFGAPPPSLPPPTLPPPSLPPPPLPAPAYGSSASLRAASAATGLPTSYSFRRDSFAPESAGLSGADRTARPQGRSRSRGGSRSSARGGERTRPRGAARGRSEGRTLARQQQRSVPARDLPLTQQPLLNEVDIVRPRPPSYRTGFRPVSGNFTAALGRSLGQVRPDCALQLKDRVCITYEAIETAFQESLHFVELDLPREREEWLPPNVASVGQALMRTSKILAHRYNLSPYEIEHVLPKADTLHTSIGDVCPDFASAIKCHPKLYRRIDGLCNNVKFPNWGASRRQFQRLLEPHYPDGIAQPNLEGLPSPRVVSATVHKDRDLFDHASTLMMIAWGQFMDHDFTLTFTRPDDRTLNEPEDCCHNTGREDCLPIAVPREDRFFARYGVDCIDFVRGQPGVRQFCRLGSRAGFNVLTSVIDAGTVYGGTDEAASELRMFVGGKLKSYMPEHFKQYGMLPLLPQRYENHDEGCIRDHPEQKCFLAGEIRVNEQLILSTMHLTWFREHNRICAIFKKLNPHWDDEKIYQETRRVVIACIQHITFNEFLPMLLGKQTMKEHDLIVKDQGYWDGYNEYEDPSIILGFMTSAYRFGHSLLPTVVEKWSPTHKYIAERDLSDLIRRPFDLYEPGAVDEYILGQLNQPTMAMDFAITDEVTNKLFRQPNKDHGIDLVSLNLQRAREMGVPGYMHYRKWCGLPTTGDWDELRQYVSNHTGDLYKRMYKSPWDIDLFSGGVSERPQRSSMVGPTFACIIAAQMHKVRHGDRFWYELGGQPSSFTPDQLQQIRRVQLSRVLCDNTDRIRTIQVYPLVLPDYDANPRVACDSGVLPHVDLNYWREDPH